MTVTLHDGREVDRNSEERRHECEARHIANMRTLKMRQDYLALVQAKRGEPEVVRLKKTIAVLWNQSKASA